MQSDKVEVIKQEDRDIIHWPEMHRAVNNLAATMAANAFYPSMIVGVSRGGAIPAVMLSHAFGAIPLDYLHVSRYRGIEGCKPQFRDQVYRHHWDRPTVLIIDDLWDDGETIRAIKDRYPHATYATVFYKAKHGTPEPEEVDFPGTRKRKAAWMVFPWELGGKA